MQIQDLLSTFLATFPALINHLFTFKTSTKEDANKTTGPLYGFELSKFRDTAFPQATVVLIVNKIKGPNRVIPSLDEYRILQTL